MLRLFKIATASLHLLGITRNVIGQCPPSFQIIFGVCVNISTSSSFNYCAAQRYCMSIGGELIFGNNFLKIEGKTFPGRPPKFWIGLTDLAKERNRKRDGWRWTDGSLTPPSAHLTWNDVDPKGDKFDKDPDCVSIVSFAHDSRCIKNRFAICQTKPKKRHDEYFMATSIPTITSILEIGNGHCTNNFTNVVSKIECAANCLSEPSTWCVSVFYHEQRRECIILLFTEAVVQLFPDDGQWQKLAVAQSHP